MSLGKLPEQVAYELADLPAPFGPEMPDVIGVSEGEFRKLEPTLPAGDGVFVHEQERCARMGFRPARAIR